MKGDTRIMKKYKEYKAPKVEVVEFECADIITDSPVSLKKKLDKTPQEHTYVYAGGKTWKDIYE